MAWIPFLRKNLKKFFLLSALSSTLHLLCLLSLHYPFFQYASKLLSLLFTLAEKSFGAEGIRAFSKLRYQIIFYLPLIEITGSGFAFLWPAPLLFSRITDGGREQGCYGLPMACHLTDIQTSQEAVLLWDELFYPQRGFLQKKPLVFCYWVSTPHDV